MFSRLQDYRVLESTRLDRRAGIEFSRYILGCSQRLASCLRHSARIGPDLLCHCHPSSVICHSLNWIVRPYYSLGWCILREIGFLSWLFRGLNSGALGDRFTIQGGAGRQVRTHIIIIYRSAWWRNVTDKQTPHQHNTKIDMDTFQM